MTDRENLKTGVSWAAAGIFLSICGFAYKAIADNQASQSTLNSRLLQGQTQMSADISHMQADLAKLASRSERNATIAEVKQMLELAMAKHQRDEHGK